MPTPPFAVDGLDSVPDLFRGGVVTIGNFDGVHRGHQALLAAARADARSVGGPAIAITFEPHPRKVFRPDEPLFRLTGRSDKESLFRLLGMDGAVVLPFDRALAATEPEAFVDLLVDRLAFKGIVVGHDFRFGKARRGSADLLRAEGAKRGFGVEEVAPVLAPTGEPYSTGRIRKALADGDVAAAERALGYRWFASGIVGQGDKRGRELGFPTANLSLDPECGLRHGIYAVRVVRANRTIHDGVANFGRRPTFGGGPTLLEPHLLDFSGDLYGERLVVSFVAWIRPEERFDSVEALVARMHKDAGEARAALAVAGAGSALDRALLIGDSG